MKKKQFMKNRPFDPTDALQMQEWIEEEIKLNFKALFTSGVATGLSAITNTGLKIAISSGIGYDINYNVINIPSNIIVNIDASTSSTLSRKDAVSLKSKKSITDNIDTGNIYGRGSSWTYSQNILDSYDIVVRKGANVASPIAPAVPNDEIYIADVLVRPSTTSIIASDITDKRVLGSFIRDLSELGATPINHVGSTGNAHGIVTNAVNGFMSAADKAKLDGIAAGANNYSHPSTHPASIIVQDASNRFVTDTEKIAWNAKASTSVVTASANGLMIASDKSKLDGITSGAEVNQFAFSTIKVGATNVVADAKQDVLELVGGTNITLTPDATNDKITISANGGTGIATTITDAGNYYNTKNVEAALQEIGFTLSGASFSLMASLNEIIEQ